MKWSKLRIRTISNVCEALRDRIDFHVATYRKSHDSDYRRGWITFDGDQIASWSCFDQIMSDVMLSFDQIIISDVKLSEEITQSILSPVISWSEFDRIMAQHGMYSGRQFMELLFEYLSVDPKVALRSKIPLFRALSIIDRRIGKRSLQKYPIKEEADQLVQFLFKHRFKKYSNNVMHR